MKLLEPKNVKFNENKDAISIGRHAPNLNWTRRMTEVKQQDYKENLFIIPA